MLTDVEAAIIAITVQAILTGAQFVTFLLCLRLHVCPDDDPNSPLTSKNIRWPMLIITILIMAFAIVDFSYTLQTRLLGLKNDSGQLSTTIIAVRNSTAQNYPKLAPDYKWREDFDGRCNRWCTGSWFEALAHLRS